MKLNFLGIIEILFPSTQDEKTLSACTDENFILKVRPCLKNGIWSFASYADPEIRAAIHLHKFHHNPKAQRLLAILCEQGCKKLPLDTYIAVPIPLSSKRKKERGYNQVTEILKEVINQIPQLTLHTHLLTKITDTVPQTSLSKSERITNVQNVFSVIESASTPSKNAHILLIDDVTTTGSTLREAKGVLQRCGYLSVTCVALAH